jgi:hypothetical protein
LLSPGAPPDGRSAPLRARGQVLAGLAELTLLRARSAAPRAPPLGSG